MSTYFNFINVLKMERKWQTWNSKIKNEHSDILVEGKGKLFSIGGARSTGYPY